jgi:hypothetical protein
MIAAKRAAYLSDVGWTAASIGFWITDATSTTTTDEVARRDVRYRWRRGCHTGRHHTLEGRSGLKRSRSLAFRPVHGRSGQNQHNDA